MIVVTGATGRTGRRVTELLLAQGKKVRAIGRDAKKLTPLVELGAESFVGTVEDVSFLTAAFAGATGAYLVLPEDLSQPDLRAHQERVSECYAAAVANAQVRFAVNLSSIGAQHAKGTGPIVGLHNQEQKLDRVAGLNVLHLRAAYFMENLFMSMAPLRATGTLPGGMRGDTPMPWIATKDIGAYAATRLALPLQMQNLTEDSPERIRSVITDHLFQIGEDRGDCFDTIEAILGKIAEYPLIYKNDIQIDSEAIRKPDDAYKAHFLERLTILSDEGTQYYYLNSIRQAEKQIAGCVKSLLQRNDHPEPPFNYREHITSSIATLRTRIPNFDEEQFISEREQLYSNVFRKSLFLLTGRPGTGKTYEASKIVDELRGQGESVVVLAPTGKAVLKLREVLGRHDDPDTVIETMDRFICGKGYRWAYEDLDRLDMLAEREKLTIDNLIIDECSMIDLQKFKVLLSILKWSSKSPRRIIMVGDENQLPPIGFGKPFHDIISFLWSDEEATKRHYVHLRTNCRQENDSNILTLAEAFTDRRRYYEEALEIVKREGKISDGLFVYHWTSKESLEEAIRKALETVVAEELKEELRERPLTQSQKLNRLFGLYENGNVNNKDYKFQEHLKLDALQLLAPYRSGYSGTLGTNAFIQGEYREKSAETSDSIFYHSDKIINLKNWYEWRSGKVDLLLSNGSIGVVKGEGRQRQFYFVEHRFPLTYLNDEENFDLAYSITVHKSQGSDFRNVFFILPNKLNLLSRELLYTALTRSRYRLFIFVQKTNENLFLYSRGISHLLSRHTSIFDPPEDRKRKYYPEKDAQPVQSKIEWIIYTALLKSGIRFKYEAPLKLKNISFEIHPDFTLTTPAGKTFYWEHLGMLDTRKYYRDWQERKLLYEKQGLLDDVITTDDLHGVRNEILDAIIQDIRDEKVKKTPENRFSRHHYELY